jgi:gamma-glutamylcyclotransferase (GGCT)/AIG2-like uncharacterized protein YtfP
VLTPPALGAIGSMSMMRTYFAYGSNMCPDQMQSRCPGAASIGIAELHDHRFMINERGVATVVPRQRSVVAGVLWDVTAAHVEVLDGFEGVAKGNYTREVVPIQSRSAGSEAMIYIACHDTPSTPRPGYLERVISGAQFFGLDGDYVTNLRSWA